jgi:hypothetical protein
MALRKASYPGRNIASGTRMVIQVQSMKTLLTFFSLSLFLGTAFVHAQPPVIAINEFMAANNGIAADSSGEFDDWVELYNNTGSAIDLSEYFLSDSYINPMKWMFPLGAVIPANGYVIVWCDNDTLQPGLHAYYKLNAAGERLILSDPSGNVVDSVSFGLQDGDTSTGRYPNGVGPYTKMLPTFSASNSPGIVGVQDAQQLVFSLFPNPASYGFTTAMPQGFRGSLTVMDMAGRCMATQSADRGEALYWDTKTWPEGMYFVTTEYGFTQKMIVRR